MLETYVWNDGGIFAVINGMMADEPSLRIYPHLQDTGGFFVAVLRQKMGGRVATAYVPSISYLFILKKTHPVTGKEKWTK
jgi:hypothetical protein